MELGAGEHMCEPVAPVESLEPHRDIVDHGCEGVARHRAAAKTLGERDDAHRKRRPGDDVVGEPRRALATGEVDQRDLGRAAADIEQHHAARVALDQRTAAGNRKAGLGLSVDDFQLEAGLALDAFEELDAIGGGAAGLGGDQPGLPDLAVAQLLAADLERLDGAVHGCLAEPAAGGQPLAQPDDARKGIDDAELAVAARHRDQQPAIVGAEIERGEHRQFLQRRARHVRNRRPRL